MRAALERVRELWRVQRSLVLEVTGAAVIAVVLVWVGSRGWSRAESERDTAAAYQAVLETTRGWEQRLERPDTLERESWMLSRMALAELAVPPSQRLELLDLVAQRADQVGVPNARVRFSQVPGQLDRSVSGWSVTSADYGLDVSFVSDFWSAVAFATSLPPMLELVSMELARFEGLVQAHYRIGVYQAVAEADREASLEPGRWPAQEWSALAPYLAPVTRRYEPLADVVAMLGEGRDPFTRIEPVREEPPPPPVVVAEPEHVWVVSAIMITDRRRVAVIDQRVVSAGDTLTGGATVRAIEPGHVTIRDRTGRVRELRVNRSDPS